MSNLTSRAFHTAYQAFLPVFIGGLANVGHVYGTQGFSGAKSALIALIVAGIAAALSAVKTSLFSSSV